MSTPQFGWAGPAAAQNAWQQIGHLFAGFNVVGQAESSAGKRVVLWDFTRKMNGGTDLPNKAQEIGDCVSWGLKHATDYLACMEILRLGDQEEFHPSYAPYFYGISRVQIGGGELGNSDGSLGSWGAEGVKKYGVLRADADGVPEYKGSVAKDWGRKGPPEAMIALARPHLIKSAARLNSYEQVRDALFNGYPCTIASMKGWSMKLKDDGGKSWFTGRDQWPHQMHLSGYDETGSRHGVFRGNSWGPTAHGPQLDGPAGGGWQDAADLDKELRSRDTECFALSQFDGFPAQSLNYLLG